MSGENDAVMSDENASDDSLYHEEVKITETKCNLLDFDDSKLDFDKLEQHVLDSEKVDKQQLPRKTQVQKIGSNELAPEKLNPAINQHPVSSMREPFSLAALLSNDNIIRPTNNKPVDVEAIEGKRDLIAQKDREAENLAKRECIDKYASMDCLLHHIMVSPIYPVHYRLSHQLQIFRKF